VSWDWTVTWSKAGPRLVQSLGGEVHLPLIAQLDAVPALIAGRAHGPAVRVVKLGIEGAHRQRFPARMMPPHPVHVRAVQPAQRNPALAGTPGATSSAVW
jgi:hypothetical protein